jgi:O-antigen/teichoic acid export membrane protein
MMTATLLATILLAYMNGQVTWTLDGEYVWASLRYGLPMIGVFVGTRALQSSGRFFLNAYADLSAVGIYSVIYSIGNLVGMVEAALNASATPVIFGALKEDNGAGTRFAARAARFELLVVCFSAMLVSIFGREIVGILATEEYVAGVTVLPFVAYGFVLNRLYKIFSRGTEWSKRTTWLSIIFVPVVVLHLAFNRVFVPLAGPLGAVLSTMSAYLVLVLLVLRISQRFHYIPYPFGHLSSFVLVTLSFSIAGTLIEMRSMLLSVIVKLGLLLVFVFLACSFGLFNRDDWRSLKHSLPGLAQR